MQGKGVTSFFRALAIFDFRLPILDSIENFPKSKIENGGGSERWRKSPAAPQL
jgi:hypothetical protein